jgi:hypothetical protein
MKNGAMSDRDEELIEALTADFMASIAEFFPPLRPADRDGNVTWLREYGRLDARETEIVLSALIDALHQALEFRSDRASVDPILAKLGSDGWYGWIAEVWGRDVKPRFGDGNHTPTPSN